MVISLLNGYVASFTDAWIETFVRTPQSPSRVMSHPLRMRGLKPLSALPRYVPDVSHPLRMRGLKLVAGAHTKLSIGRILYGCVD